MVKLLRALAALVVIAVPVAGLIAITAYSSLSGNDKFSPDRELLPDWLITSERMLATHPVMIIATAMLLTTGAALVLIRAKD